MSIKREIERLHLGKIGMDRFLYLTRRDWMRLAAKQRKRFKAVPAAVELQDIQQELMLAAAVAYGEWLPEGGQPLHRFVIVRAVQRAMDWINKQRNSYRRLSNSPSRCELLYENIATSVDHHDNPFDGLKHVDAVQEEHVEFVQRAQRMTTRAKEAATTSIERACFDALLSANYDIDTAARLLYSDPSIRLRARLGSRSDATRTITRAITTNAAIAA